MTLSGISPHSYANQQIQTILYECKLILDYKTVRVDDYSAVDFLVRILRKGIISLILLINSAKSKGERLPLWKNSEGIRKCGVRFTTLNFHPLMSFE